MALLRGDGDGAGVAARGRGTARRGRALLARVRSWRADLALVLPPSFSSAWFAWRTGATRRVGYRGEARCPLLTRALPRPARGDRHLAEEYLALAGGGRGGAGPARARPAWRRRGRPGATRCSVRAPAYGPAKRWPADRFAEVGRALVARGLGVQGGGHARRSARCARRSPPGSARARSRWPGPRTWRSSRTSRRGAAVAVCNDSGLAHVCAAAGAPTVVVFGSTSSAWTAPLGPRVRVVQRAPVCSPCFRRDCRIGYPCLGAVTAPDVLAACDGLRAGREAA